jgi:Opioid growth factor receptor (OGFr) conserved region
MPSINPSFQGPKPFPSRSNEIQFKHANDPLFRFLRGEGADFHGRFFNEILDWDDDRKEGQHDYIQALFPLKEQSMFNPDAYILNDALLEEMKQDPKVIENMHKAFETMLNFYGLRLQDNKIFEAANFDERSEEWLTPSNHNFLRLTRILKSLILFGLHHEAQMLFDALQKIHKQNPEITRTSFSYWEQAIKT